MCNMHTRYRSLHFSIVGKPLLAVAYNIAKVQSNKIYIRCIASSPKFLWYGSMEWNMEENFSMEWNMEENFSMEWKWNGRKLPVWNMEKSSSIPFHTMPCPEPLNSFSIICLMSIFPSYFLKSILCVKTGEVNRWYNR